MISKADYDKACEILIDHNCNQRYVPADLRRLLQALIDEFDRTHNKYCPQCGLEKKEKHTCPNDGVERWR